MSDESLQYVATLNNIGSLLYERGENFSAIEHYHEANRVRIATMNKTGKDSDEAIFDQLDMNIICRTRALEMENNLRSLRRKDSQESRRTKHVDCDVGMECFSEYAIQIDSFIAQKTCTEANNIDQRYDFVRCYLHADDYEKNDSAFFSILAHNIGLIYLRMKDLSLALVSFEKSLSAASKNDRPHTTMLCLHHIGRIHYMEKRYEASLNAFSMALHEGRKIESTQLHEDKNDTQQLYYSRFIASTLLCMGSTYMQRNDLSIGMVYSQEALFLHRKLHSRENHWNTASAEYVIGRIHHINGEDKEALKYYNTFLEKATVQPGERHLHVAATLDNIGDILYKQNKLNEAFKCYLRSLQTRSAVLGDNHVDVARTLYRVGRVLHEQENYVDALEIYKRTLRIQQVVLGWDHVEVLETMHNVGRVHHIRGELNKALAAHRKAFEISVKVLGYLHPFAALSLKTVGNICLEMGHREDALGFLVEAHNIDKTLHLNENDDTATAAVLLHINGSRAPDAAAA